MSRYVTKTCVCGSGSATGACGEVAWLPERRAQYRVRPRCDACVRSCHKAGFDTILRKPIPCRRKVEAARG